MKFGLKKFRIPFGWFCIVFFCLFYCIQNHNHRFWLSDFKVYYLAAQNLLSDKPIYNQAFGLASGVYKYSPVALLAFVPFAEVPFFVAATVYFGLLSFFIYLTIKKASAYAASTAGIAASTTVPFLILLIAGAHFFRELHLGNINTVLLLLNMLALEYLGRGGKIIPGICIGMTILFKPHFVLVLPVLLLFRRLTPCIAAIGTVIIGFLAPAVTFGLRGDFALHGEWLRTMVGHNAQDELIKAPNTLQHLASLCLPQGSSGMNLLITVLGMLGMYCIVVFVLRKQPAKTTQYNILAFSFFICIAAIPNITLTDTEHFLFLVPLIAYLLTNFSKQTFAIKILIVIAFVMYGGNWFDLWGRSLSDALQRWGMLGTGNAAVIALSVYVWKRNQKTTASDDSGVLQSLENRLFL